MPRSENQKLKTIYIAEFFKKYTDENHPTTVRDIKSYLEDDCGITAEQKSIYRDIQLLCDVYGMDIDWVKGGKYYKLLSRDFELDDLRLLAECVHATKFISTRKAKELVKKISEFGSVFDAEQLQEEVFLCDRVKTTQTAIIRSISTINQAMAKKWDGKPHIPSKISFQYMKYSINDVHNQVERRKGAKYIVSPFKMLINEGNYYLLAYNSYFKDMRTYRVDRMKNVNIVDEPREGDEAFEQIDMETFTERVFNMFGGNEKRVEIRFTNDLLDTVIERFGTEHFTHYLPSDDYHFTVTTNVQISDQFYGWLCGFRKKAAIVSPPDVIEDMKKFLYDITQKYEVE